LVAIGHCTVTAFTGYRRNTRQNHCR